MGVKGLWQLLLPTGRRISIETLTGKTLAIDASIWLTQFIKAHRDPETGKVHHAAHIIGFFRRICKLLYHGIKPIFVFDGDTPEIKLMEIRKRRERREKIHSFASSNDIEGVKRLAKRLLVANLKKQKELEIAKNVSTRRNKGDDDDQNNNSNHIDDEKNNQGALASGFHLPDENTSCSNRNSISNSNMEVQEKNQNENKATGTEYNDIAIDKILSETRDYIDKNLIQVKSQPEQNDWDNPFSYNDHNDNDNDSVSNESIEIPDDENYLNTKVLSSLPTKTRIDVIEKAKRQQRMQSRREFMSVAANPDSYSQCQLKNFLKSATFSKKIHEVGQIVSKQGEFGVGEKIASDATRRFIFTKDIDDAEEEEEEKTEENKEEHVEKDAMLIKNSVRDSPTRKRRRLVKVSNTHDDVGEGDDDDDILFWTETNKVKDHPSKKVLFHDDDSSTDKSENDDDGGGGFFKCNNLEDESLSKRESMNKAHHVRYNHQAQNIIPKINLHKNVDTSDDESNEVGGGFIRSEDTQYQGQSSISLEKDAMIEINSDDDDSDEGGGFIRSQDTQHQEYLRTCLEKNVMIEINSDDDDSDEGGGFIKPEDTQNQVHLRTGLEKNVMIEINGGDDDSDEGGGFVQPEDTHYQENALVEINCDEDTNSDDEEGGGFITTSVDVDEEVGLYQNNKNAGTNAATCNLSRNQQIDEVASECDERVQPVEDSGCHIKLKECGAKSIGDKETTDVNIHEIDDGNEKTNLISNMKGIREYDNHSQLGEDDEDIEWEDGEAENSADNENLSFPVDANIGETDFDNEVIEVKCKINGSSRNEVGITNHTNHDEHAQSDNDFNEEVDWEEGDQEIETNAEDINDGLARFLESRTVKDANSLALKRAQTTASSLADWAGRAVQRAISAHLDELGQQKNNVESEKEDSSDSEESVSVDATSEKDVHEAKETETIIQKDIISNNISQNDLFDTSLEALREVEMNMREEDNRRERDMETVTDDMIEEVMHLLQLFGIPYLKAPAEAEAQCVALEKLGLVDGVCTEDSDGKASHIMSLSNFFLVC